MSGTNNFTIVSGDSIPIQIEDCKTFTTLKASHTNSPVSGITTEPMPVDANDTSVTSLTVENTEKTRQDERNSIDSKDVKSEQPESNSTLQQVELVEISKKAKLSKSLVIKKI